MPTSVEGLLIVSVVLVPGFILTLIVTRTIAHIHSSNLRFVLTIISMGIVIHGLLFPWTVRIADYYQSDRLLDHRWEIFGWGFLTVLVAPMVLGIFVAWLSTRQWVDRLLAKINFSYIDRTPSAWEYIFLQRRSYYVRIHLNDGRGVLGGVYGPHSFASTDPNHNDLFLQELWQLDE